MNGLDGINVSRRMSREVETGRKILCALEKIVSRVKLKRKERSSWPTSGTRGLPNG